LPQIQTGFKKEKVQKDVLELENQLKQYNLSPIESKEKKMTCFGDLHPQMISGLPEMVIPKAVYPKAVYPKAAKQASTGTTDMHQTE
jgi:hypothetical protein